MSFFLVRLQSDDKGRMIDVPIPDYGPYEKGSDAAKVAKTLTESLGTKVQPRRISQAADWRARQEQRLKDGTLTPLPKEWTLPPIKDHFAHLQKEKHPGKICFTETDELGAIDRVTVLSPGRYITRFYDPISDEERRRLIATVDASGEILFAWTPEEIEYVYRNGPDSCMDGDHDFEDYPMWPTGPYGAGDLAVAYSVNERGRIQSRCVCWPAKKLFGRVYGDESRMKKRMIDDGYTWLRENQSNHHKFIGARILKVPYEDGEYVMPYFDDIGMVLDRGEFFVTADKYPDDENDRPKKMGSGGTRGLQSLERWCPKEKCYYADRSFKFVKGDDANEEWSQPAISRHAFTCYETGELWSIKNRVILSDGNAVCTEWFNANGARCEATGKSCRRSDLVDDQGKQVSKAWLRRKNLIPESPFSNKSGAVDRHYRTLRPEYLSYDDPITGLPDPTVRDLARGISASMNEAITRSFLGILDEEVTVRPEEVTIRPVPPSRAARGRRAA